MILGNGIDIIEIERIQKAIDRWGNHFLHHVFLDEEIAYAQENKFPVQHYAARFAAKEAIFKAFGNKPDIRWKDIKILNDANGKPYGVINDKHFKDKIYLSISHTHAYAVAHAIITQ
ncbi:MAG: holo-ACP synthase [Candidatus Omnitrophota bacterium]|jgi:holo-[acyl-carrier protein] synthase|nr:holo-ACP synthase [Candidatus Omnitrophota bacterium]